jgi:hypothetical protein
LVVKPQLHVPEPTRLVHYEKKQHKTNLEKKHKTTQKKKKKKKKKWKK